MHKVPAGCQHRRNSWFTEPMFKLCSRTSKSLSLRGGWRGCWRPLFHILTVNFSEINCALHYVPFIFYLILMSSISFGWVLILGEHLPKMDKNGWKPRPTGLAPLHYMLRLRSRGNVTCVHLLWAEDWMSVWSDELKGLSMDQRTHKLVQHQEQSSNPTS